MHSTSPPHKGRMGQHAPIYHRRDLSAKIHIHRQWSSSGHSSERLLGSESAFFDVRISNPNAPSNHTPSCVANYCHHEKAKRNLNEERIREVEHATFTPLVFTASGGASPLTSTFLKHLASRLAERRDMAYSTTIGWLRVRLNFSLLRSAVMCIRGS